jgi:hypothetical protein
MPRKLKTYQTSQGFFDLAIAAPSMKAALEAWGSTTNLFHQGFAWESDDRRAIEAATARPGVVLKRPVGTSEPFQEHSHLPTSLPVSGGPEVTARTRHFKNKRQTAKPAVTSKKKTETDEKAARKAALAYEKEERRRRKRQQKEEAAAAKKRALRQQAEEKAEAALEKARSKHEAIVGSIDKEREAVERRAEAENARWENIRKQLDAAFRKARSQS